MEQKSLKTSKVFIAETGIFSCRLNAYKWNTFYKGVLQSLMILLTHPEQDLYRLMTAIN